MAELETGIQDAKKGNNEDLKSMSREERIKKYYSEIYWPRNWTYVVPPLPIAKRLERRAEQRAFKRMTPEEQAKYRENGIHRTKRRAWISLAAYKKFGYEYGTTWTDKARKLFRATGRLKAARKVELHLSTPANPAAENLSFNGVADNGETCKEKISVKETYREKIRMEKFIKQEKAIRRDRSDYRRLELPQEPEQNKPEKDAETQHVAKDYEEKLRGIIDGLDQKSASGRASTFTSLQETLSQHFMPNIVIDVRSTIVDALKRALKKNHNTEQLAAGRLAPILCIQLGENHCQEFVREVRSAFINIITNNTIDTRVRAECCQSLATIILLSKTDMPDVLDLMKTYEIILSASNSKGNCNINENESADSTIQTAALNAWTLLLALCSPADVHSLLDRTSSTSLFLSRLIDLLKAPTLEVQMAAGIALSLAYELGLEYSEEFGQDELDTVISKTKQLAQGSHKFRARKDCKIQRRTFRNVLRSLEEKIAPVQKVYIGREHLKLDKWSSLVLYHRLAAALGTGLQTAIGSNLLRSALRMEPLLHEDMETPVPKDQKHNKQEKHRQNSKASKARSILRQRNRDKRYVGFDL